MKKKLTILFLCALTLLCACFALVSCDKNQKGDHTHTYDQKVTKAKYRIASATCTESAVYYYTCKCGEVGTQTFSHGAPRGHYYQLIVGGTYQTGYAAGEIFDATGMEVTKECLDCEDTGVVTNYTISPSGALTAETTQITISVESTDEEYYNPLYIDVEVAANVTVTSVDLILDESSVYYVVSGKYVSGYNISIDNTYFDLATAYDAYVYVDKDDVILTTEPSTHTFTLKADVTNWSTADCGLYPHMHADGDVYDLVEKNNVWNGKYVEANNSKYIILQTAGTYNMPLLTRVYTGTKAGAGTLDRTASNETGNSKIFYGTDVYYQPTGVQFKQEGQQALIVISGVSQGFTALQLESSIDFRLASGATFYYYNTDGGAFTFDDSTGNWTLSWNVSALPSGLVYYSRIINEDFDCLTVDQVTGEGTSVTIGSKKYTFIYDPTASTADEAWGTIGVKVETVTA